MVSASVLAFLIVLAHGATAPPEEEIPNPEAAGSAASEPQEPISEGDEPDAVPTEPASPFDWLVGRTEEREPDPPTGLTFSLSLGGARDTGVRFDEPLSETGELPVDGVADAFEAEDTAYVIAPSLLLHRRPSRRSEVILAYQAELERFDERTDLDATHHAAGARFEHLVSRRSRLVFGGSLLDGEDPSRHLGGQLLVLPHTPFSQSRVFAGLEHVWTSTGLLFYVGRTATEIEPTVGLLSAGLDESEYAATLTVDRTLSKRTGLIGSYSFVVPDWSDPAGGTPDPDAPPLAFTDPVHSGVIGITHRPSERIALHVAAGVLYGDEPAFLGSAGIARDGRAFSFRLRYERSMLALDTFAPGAIGSAAPPIVPTAALRDAVSQSATASFAVRPIDRVRLEQYLWGARTTLETGEPLESLTATSRLVIKTIRRIGIFGQYEWFEQNGAPLLGGPLVVGELSRSRISAGFIVGLAGPPQTWGVPDGVMLLERVLPSARKE